VVVLLVAVAVAAFLRHRSAGVRAPAAHEDEPSSSAGDRRWMGFAAGTPSIAPELEADAAPGVGPTGPAPAGAKVEGWALPEFTKAQVQSAIDAWRQAILVRNSDTVLTLDHAFAEYPGRYGPALLKLADTDSDPRIRAFSTRVLGKMKNAALEADFEQLMGDQSPYVRQNAAWALGELGDQPAGHEAAQAAMAVLRRLQDEDPATDVRVAATNALKKLQ